MKNLIPIARNLRKRSTETEKLLWFRLRSRQLNGLKFRRQTPISEYIVDFVCHEKKLIIELDGGQHAENIEADKIRDQLLEEQGYKVLRFWNNEVLTNIEGVLSVISSNCITPSP